MREKGGLVEDMECSRKCRGHGLYVQEVVLTQRFGRKTSKPAYQTICKNSKKDGQRKDRGHCEYLQEGVFLQQFGPKSSKPAPAPQQITRKRGNMNQLDLPKYGDFCITLYYHGDVVHIRLRNGKRNPFDDISEIMKKRYIELKNKTIYFVWFSEFSNGAKEVSSISSNATMLQIYETLSVYGIQEIELYVSYYDLQAQSTSIELHAQSFDDDDDDVTDGDSSDCDMFSEDRTLQTDSESTKLLYKSNIWDKIDRSSDSHMTEISIIFERTKERFWKKHQGSRCCGWLYCFEGW
jgi:hypothetical protein